jgi:ABC-type phosphate transport system ATPase subunit
MTAPSLPAALQAGAEGLYALEAATGLIIAHGTWLTRDDFTCLIHHGTKTAAIDWEAVTATLETGGLPSSGGERRMLRLAASLAGQASVILGDAITSIDDRNTGLLVKAVLHASRQRQFPTAR